MNGARARRLRRVAVMLKEVDKKIPERVTVERIYKGLKRIDTRKTARRT